MFILYIQVYDSKMIETIEANRDWDFEVKDYLQSHRYIDPNYSTEKMPTDISFVFQFRLGVQNKVKSLLKNIREKRTTSRGTAILVGTHIRRRTIFHFQLSSRFLRNY